MKIIRQRVAAHPLHDDEGIVLVFAELVNRDNVGMYEPRGRLRLALQTSQAL